MAGDIQHSALPDSLLHEPKGASTASAGEVYVADGNASGSFMMLPLSNVDFTRTLVTDLTPSTITGTVSLNGSALTHPADGILLDVPVVAGIPQTITNKINENASELYRLYNNQATINTELTNAIHSLEAKLNVVIDALQAAGVVEQ